MATLTLRGTKGSKLTHTELDNNLTALNNDKLETAGGTLTGNLTVPSLNGGPLAGLRNKIINGNFDIWQRGTSLSSGSGKRYLADRWDTNSTGTTSVVTREAFSLGVETPPNNPAYFQRTVITSLNTASSHAALVQPIENVRILAGKTVTLSFWAKADAPKFITSELIQVFGTGGSPSVPTTSIGSQKFSITTVWQKFVMTANLPSVAGKTLGTNNDDRVSLFLWLDAGSNFDSRTDYLGSQSGTFDIAQVQLEEGAVATPFEQRPIGLELALCQRYYYRETTNGVNQVPYGGHVQSLSATAARLLLRFPVQMRVRPTALEQSGVAADFQLVHGGTATALSSVPTFQSSTEFAAGVDLPVASGLTAGQAGFLRSASASNTYLGFSAEL